MGPDGIPPILLSKCASVLYKPLHYLFNLTLKFGYLPCEWKVHKIIPVFKSGDPTHINNYRPISLLSNTSKVLERILHDKIIGHVTSRINPAQFGFIQNHSSVQQLLLVLSDIFTSRHQLDIIYPHTQPPTHSINMLFHIEHCGRHRFNCCLPFSAIQYPIDKIL